MANELSRLGDRLPRARERIPSGDAGAWVTASTHLARRELAQREPNLRAPSRHVGRDERDPSDADAQSGRPPATVVAIHVEVRHPVSEAAVAVVDAHADAADAADERDELDARPPHLFAVDRVPTAEALVHPVKSFGQASASAPGAESERSVDRTPYIAVRAQSAYITQQTLMTAVGHESRILDVQA